ncbi:hypothetical protein V8B55DRAFT_1512344 [Mucor lusitanicus]|uniref:Uncharacterized protein n=1 Tax=Mucor circinelloides f. lusitanicus TaxID=29924 RepID=A0A8H4BMU4_MUCCL|nr:hypothetical protein FB192DRAFT_1371896 [Mucor lusitanicus]
MYKKRQRIYKDLALNADEGLPEFPDEGDIGQEKEEEGHASDDGSVNSNATHQRSEAGDERSSEAAGQHDQVPDGGNPDTAPTSTPPATTVNKREEPAYRPRSKIARMKTDKPVEIGYRKGIIDSRRQEDGIKKAKYDPDLKKLIPKGAEWQLMQDSVRMQMRQILSDDYRKTLSNIAGSTTFGDLSRQTQHKGQKLLLPIASKIDKELRLTLIPGKIDNKLLDFEIPVSYRKLNQQVEDSLRKVADFSIKVDEREAGLIPLRAELAELEERYRITKERHDSRVSDADSPRDYVQMLFLHPSSEQY